MRMVFRCEVLWASRKWPLVASFVILSACGSGAPAKAPVRHTPISTLSATPGPALPPRSGWRPVDRLSLEPETHGRHYKSPLSDVSAADTRSVFAVGSDGEPAVNRTEKKYGSPLALRWNGNRWERITSGLPQEGGLDVVAALSATKAWAMGREWLRYVPGQERRWRTHLYRWDGRSWRSVLSDDAQNYKPDRLAASPDGNVWLARNESSRLQHWDGHSWAAQPLPCGQTCGVTQLDARIGTDVWAFTVTGSGRAAYHWNGSSWKTVALPQNTGAVTATPSGDIWVLGDTCLKTVTQLSGKPYVECTSHHTWAERWRAGRWQETPLPTAATGLIPSDRELATGSSGSLMFPVRTAPRRYLYYDGGRWTLINGADRPPDQACDPVSVKGVPGTSSFIEVGETIHEKACMDVDGTLGRVLPGGPDL